MLTIEDLISGLTEDHLKVKVLVKVPGSSGTYIQTLGVSSVQKNIVTEECDGVVGIDVKHSSIVINTTPNPEA